MVRRRSDTQPISTGKLASPVSTPIQPPETDGNPEWGFPQQGVERALKAAGGATEVVAQAMGVMNRAADLIPRKDPPAFLDADSSDPMSVSVTIGPYTYSPVKYNSFVAGPVSVTVWRGEGESDSALYERATKLCGWMYDREFESALQRYQLEIRRADLVTKGNAGPSR
jgi:hypothetical protein